MEKINNQLKLKIIAIIVISNILVFLSFTDNEVAPLNSGTTETTIFRENFVEFKLSAKLHTNFEFNKPVTIINKSRSIVIKHAILLEKSESSNMNSNELLLPGSTKQDEVSIYIHKKHIPALIGIREALLVPFNSISKSRSIRRNYEILL